jgi:mannose-6-phosphate isomerase
MLYPLLFKPVFQERIWGGRNLEKLYGKTLPASVPIGESWEICDRADVQSEIANGPLAGKTLDWLMQQHGSDLMGEALALHGHFPLLIKILDAREKLSLQVHPPPEKAAALNGEPKTEMWYITRAEPGAELYVGLRKDVSRQEFETKITNGTVADCFHRVPVRSGDAMFLPSGRVHAIGAGLVIFEIQQNSDTTYRVFDWNRLDPEGKPRQLHVEQSLECIDFEDFEPEPIRRKLMGGAGSGLSRETLVEHPLFSVEIVSMNAPARLEYSFRAPQIIAVVEGTARILHDTPLQLGPGEFCLVPACVQNAKIEADGVARLLIAQPGRS